ncbi:MAG: restriction endonuclease [Cytophagaceae bacterium]|nr:restriction endonuclease [Cytophagaceae bacterium]
MIPDFQTVMLPILEILSDRQEHSIKELVDAVATQFGLTEDEREALLESGSQPIITNRVSWAKTYLLKAGLINSPKRGTFLISPEGLKVLTSKPDKVNIRYLRNFTAFQEWQSTSKPRKYEEKAASDDTEELEVLKTPQELLELSQAKLREELAFEVLDKVKSCSPAFFERLVVDLLLKMGYGGSRKDAGQVLGKTGDGGIDGIISEDKLGLDVIYIQAKRWNGQVPVSEVRDFAGSLLAKRSNKGVFITTSNFPQTAFDFVKSTGQRIVLMDGKQLAELMIEHNVGVSIREVYELKRVDSDYFEEI